MRRHTLHRIGTKESRTMNVIMMRLVYILTKLVWYLNTKALVHLKQKERNM